jgi:pyruvate,water dikinase
VDVLHQVSGPGTNWSRVNMAESVVGVQSPLSWTLWDAGGELGFRIGYRALGLVPRSFLTIPDSIDDQFTGIFYGQGACNIDTFVAAMSTMPGAAAAEEGFFASTSGRGRRLGASRRRWFVRVWLPLAALALPWRLRQLRGESKSFWRKVTAPGALRNEAQAKAAFREALRRFAPAVGMQVTASTYAAMFYGRVQRLLAQVERPDLELKVMGGYGSMQEIELTHDLWRVARTGGDLRAFLAEHGFHGPAEGELSSRSWREDPAPIEAMRAKFTAMDAREAPDAAERRQVEERRSAERLVLARTHGVDRLRARALLALSRRYIPLRVEAKAAFMRVFDAARAAARAVGERLAAAGRIDDPDDVFYLTVDELLASLPDDVKGTIRERRATRSSYLTVELPLEWVGMPTPTERVDAVGNEQLPTDHITALGVSGGKAEGIARVLVDPHDPDALEPGDILVCHTTDPSWSSHFVVAAGVVIDVGGMLSHGAIVARELGIPCVINTKNGTSVIRSGDRVVVDGDAGTVEIRERAGEP